jgi:capsular polysaccharide biosynthesis protein
MMARNPRDPVARESDRLIPPEEQPPRQILGQFVSMRTLAAALRRRRRFWVSLALVGLILGVASTVLLPSKYSATSDLLMQHNPADDPTLDMANDVALLQSYVVAAGVVDTLKLPETAQTFLGQYQGVALSDGILQVTVSAPTSAEAVARTAALDTVFLDKRAQLFTAENTATVSALQSDAATVSTQADRLEYEISKAEAAGASASSSTMVDLSNTAADDLAAAGQYDQDILTDNNLTASINSSHPLGPPAALHSSKVKKLIADPGTGLVAGLAVGCGLVAFEALAFERLRRRDDIARVLGAPVDIAVPPVARPRLARIARLRRSLERPVRSVRLMVGSLRSLLASAPSPGLAIVSIDSLEAASLSVAALARSLAAEGRQVTLLDLSHERLLCQLLGLEEPGTKVVFVGTEAPVTLVWQEEADIAFGNSGSRRAQARRTADRWETEVVLALVTLDPAYGARHLIGQVTDAVAVVSVGRSKEARVQSVAEMLEAAGIILRTAIVVGSDVDDDSLGSIPAPAQPTLSSAPTSVELAD